MFPRILKRFQEKVRTRQYVMTLHAEEEMDEDGLSIFDVERGILTGRLSNARKTTIPASGNISSAVKRWQAGKSLL